MPEPTIAQRLAEPFDLKFVKFKPQTVSGNRCLAVAYIDVRAVIQRLDAVLGIGGWQDDYEFLANGAVACRLQVHIDGVWVTKTDVGNAGKASAAENQLKATVSDALKRAATKVGVGRYLYYLKGLWVDYDPQKKQIVNLPELPSWARPYPKSSNGVAGQATVKA
jgi:hypothetical protein